jgi:putative nucleotidyltransferase with HDIG domain
MGKVNIDSLEPGMVLAEDLFHADGRLLLSKGLKLASNHLRVLKIWGVAAAEIEGASNDPRSPTLEETDPAVLKEAQELTRKQFSHANVEHPFLGELFRICTLRRAHRMALQETPGSDGGAAVVRTAPTGKVISTAPVGNRKRDLASLLDEDVALVSLPHIFTEINRVISDPRSSAVHVADVISKDPNLTARLLRIVNSAFYGFPSKIDTISRAVTILGSRQLSTLALGTSVLEIFKDIPATLVDMKSFWEHSVACGIAARMIASYKNIVNTERLFVAGLLHDIGRLITYRYLPEQGREMLLYAQQNDCLLRSAELKVLGFDHSQIGTMLMQKWKLPVILEQAVGYHHQPMLSQYIQEASIVHVADILINALMIGTSGERFVPPVIPEVWTELGLPTEIFTGSVQLVDRQVAEVIYNFFEGN